MMRRRRVISYVCAALLGVGGILPLPVVAYAGGDGYAWRVAIYCLIDPDSANCECLQNCDPTCDAHSDTCQQLPLPPHTCDENGDGMPDQSC